jgi:hypothetical protein
MLPIIVEGRGLIPRGFGIAPRLTPFPADLQLIATIMNQGGLSASHVDPITKKKTPLTRENVRKVWDRYVNKKVEEKKEVKNSNKPSVPVIPNYPHPKTSTPAEKSASAPINVIQDPIPDPFPKSNIPGANIPGPPGTVPVESMTGTSLGDVPVTLAHNPNPIVPEEKKEEEKKEDDGFVKPKWKDKKH